MSFIIGNNREMKTMMFLQKEYMVCVLFLVFFILRFLLFLYYTVKTSPFIQSLLYDDVRCARKCVSLSPT